MVHCGCTVSIMKGLVHVGSFQVDVGGKGWRLAAGGVSKSGGWHTPRFIWETRHGAYFLAVLMPLHAFTLCWTYARLDGVTVGAVSSPVVNAAPELNTCGW